MGRSYPVHHSKNSNSFTIHIMHQLLDFQRKEKYDFHIYMDEVCFILAHQLDLLDIRNIWEQQRN